MSSAGRLEVELLGHVLDWRLSGWDVFARRIRDALSGSSGDFCVEQLVVPEAGNSTRAFVDSSIEREIESVVRDTYGSGVEFVHVDSDPGGDGRGGVLEALSETLATGLRTTDGPVRIRELAERVVAAVHSEPLVVWFEDVEPAQVESIENLKDTCTAVRGRAVRRPVVFLVVGTRLVSGMGRGLDLTRAWPIPKAIDVVEPSVDSARRWRTYVHLRLAWLVGGSLGTLGGDTIDEFVHSNLSRGDDRALEEFLCRVSARLYDDLEDATRETFDAWRDDPNVLTGSSRGEPFDAAALSRIALGSRIAVTWRTGVSGGLDTLAPAPWISRALLDAAGRPWTGCPRMRCWLRQQLLCRPLVESALSCCLQVETTLRTRNRDVALLSGVAPMRHGYMGKSPWETCRDFHDHARRLPRSTYPPTHPGVPGDVGLEFVTLGALAHDSSKMPMANTVRELARVRNALAHQLSDSWALLVRLTDLVETLLGL